MADTWTRSENEVLATLQEVVAIDSVNPEFPGATRGEAPMVEYLSEFFGSINIPYELQEVLPGRSNIIATLEGADPNRRLVFDCHMDVMTTEKMTIPPFEPHIRDGKLYGRGSCDTKAGGVAMIHAMKRIAESGKKPPCSIVYAGVVDEEYLMRGAAHYAERCNAEAVVVSEPTELKVVCAHKGVARFGISIKGKAAHTSKPELGVNAISKMARLIGRIETEIGAVYAERAHPLLGVPTCTVGIIGGGTLINIVPDQCSIDIDCRVVSPQTLADVVGEFRELLDAAMKDDPELDIEFLGPYQLLSALDTDESETITKTAAAACQQLLGRSEVVGVPYATDGSHYAKAGIPSVVLGPGNIDQAHRAVEWVECEQVVQAVELYQFIMENFE